MSAGGRQSLLRLYKSVPLPKINNFRIELPKSSSISLPPIHVHLLPQWREDGHITLEQVLPPAKNNNHPNENYSDMTQQVDWNIHIQDKNNDETKDVTISIDYLHPPKQHQDGHNNDLSEKNGSSNSTTTASSLSHYSNGDILAHTLGEEGEDDTDVDLSSFSDLGVGNDNNNNNNRPLPSITLLAKLPERMTNLEVDLTNTTMSNGDDSIIGRGGHQLSLLDSSIGKSAKKFQILESIQFHTNGGNVQFHGCTVRANHIQVNARGGNIHVGKTMEAQKLELQTSTGRATGGRIRCQKINASSCSISITNNTNNNNDNHHYIRQDDNNHNHTDVKLLDKDDEGAMIDISSLYTTNTGTGADLYIDNHNYNQRLSQIRVKSNHGHIAVDAHCFKNEKNNHKEKCNKPIVDLGGINGSFDVSVSTNSTNAADSNNNNNNNNDNNNNNNNNDQSNVVAGQIHVDSLAPQSMSIFTSDVGDVNMTIDRKIHSDVRFLSCPYISHLDPELLLSSLDINNKNENVEDHDFIVNAILSACQNDTYSSTDSATCTAPNVTTSSSKDENEKRQIELIQINTNAFTGHTVLDSSNNNSSSCYMEGTMENKSQEPSSRFEELNKNKSNNNNNSGKISLQGAADQALHGFSCSSNNDDFKILPLMAVGTHGKIHVETVSWLGAIARRYGLDEITNKPNLGRQAQAGNPSLRRENQQRPQQ